MTSEREILKAKREDQAVSGRRKIAHNGERNQCSARASAPPRRKEPSPTSIVCVVVLATHATYRCQSVSVSERSGDQVVELFAVIFMKCVGRRPRAPRSRKKSAVSVIFLCWNVYISSESNLSPVCQRQ